MKRSLFNLKKVIWLIPLLILGFSILIPSTLAFYYYNTNSLVTTNFKINQNITTVVARATIITYWEDKNTNQMIAKNPWTLKEDIINDNWIKLDEYYYLKGSLSPDEIKNNIPTSKELIDNTLEINLLSNEDLNNAKYNAKYKIVYEFLEFKTDSNINSTVDAWNVIYSEEFIPSKAQ